MAGVKLSSSELLNRRSYTYPNKHTQFLMINTFLRQLYIKSPFMNTPPPSLVGKYKQYIWPYVYLLHGRQFGKDLRAFGLRFMDAICKSYSKLKIFGETEKLPCNARLSLTHDPLPPPPKKKRKTINIVLRSCYLHKGYYTEGTLPRYREPNCEFLRQHVHSCKEE